MADKDYEGLLDAFEPVMAEIVCTQNTTARAMPAEELAEVARGIFGNDRVHVARRLDDAIDKAAGLAEAGGVYGEAIGSGGVLVTGSVITVGEARSMLRPRESER
jgi:dihydrofolate synthase/folylpolyglutamate synthase